MQSAAERSGVHASAIYRRWPSSRTCRGSRGSRSVNPPPLVEALLVLTAP